MANISFFFPKAKQGGALGINGGMGNMGVSVMQLIAPLAISVSIFAVFGGGGAEQPDGSMLYLQNAAWIWVPFLVVLTLLAWFFMNDLSASKASLSEQLPVLKRAHLWIMGAALSGNVRIVYRLLCRFRHAVENPVPGCTDPALRVLRPVHWRPGTFNRWDDFRPSGAGRALRWLTLC
ncbi:nitrite extrusion protein 1 [Lelliottia amnigena]|nr:nitrite extrusion protein 1 [Lelliottia amnigena]